MDKEKVWVADHLSGFTLGRIVDIGIDGPIVQPLDRSLKPIVASYDRLWQAEDDDNKEVDDNCGLMYLNEATLLNNVRLRYAKDKIYTYVANILIAVNPYFELKNLYSEATIKSYEGKSLGTLPPPRLCHRGQGLQRHEDVEAVPVSDCVGGVGSRENRVNQVHSQVHALQLWKTGWISGAENSEC